MNVNDPRWRDKDFLKSKSKEEIEIMVSNAIYEANHIFERLEAAGVIFGNGHHIAQVHAEIARKEIPARWRDK